MIHYFQYNKLRKHFEEIMKYFESKECKEMNGVIEGKPDINENYTDTNEYNFGVYWFTGQYNKLIKDAERFKEGIH